MDKKNNTLKMNVKTGENTLRWSTFQHMWSPYQCYKKSSFYIITKKIPLHKSYGKAKQLYFLLLNFINYK